MASKDDPLTIEEIYVAAKKKLPKWVHDYYACGADDERALLRNEEAYRRVHIMPRVLVDVSEINTSMTLLGRKYSFPIAFAPSAMQKLAGDEGELDTARAAASLGIGMTLSSQSTTSLEDVMAAARSITPHPNLWFQLYLTSDVARNLSLIRRAEAAGYEALVITVDTPVLGNRLNERHHRFILPPHLELAHYRKMNDEKKTDDDKDTDGTNRTKSTTRENKPNPSRLLMDARTAAEARAIWSSSTLSQTLHDPSLTWSSLLPRLRAATKKVKIILKGVMHPEDASLAVRHGIDGIVVSNHGGRQLDSCPSTLEALPSVVDAVKAEEEKQRKEGEERGMQRENKTGRKMAVLVDGGVRRGSDVFKALALGADAVLLGRPVLWGLAYEGRAGVERMGNTIERELSRCMGLAGVADVGAIGREALRVGGDGRGWWMGDGGNGRALL